MRIDKTPESDVRRILDLSVEKAATVQRASIRAFADSPPLEEISLSFIRFVSPWLVLDGENLAERTLAEAVMAYVVERANGPEAGYRSFLKRLAQAAVDLSQYRISVQDADGLWVVWSYDEPLMRHLANFKRSSIQIRRREQSVDVGPVMIKLLAAVGTTKVLNIARLDFNKLLSGSAA